MASDAASSSDESGAFFLPALAFVLGSFLAAPFLAAGAFATFGSFFVGGGGGTVFLARADFLLLESSTSSTYLTFSSAWRLSSGSIMLKICLVI